MRYLVYILIILPQILLGQNNLVPNSSFENKTQCPTNPAQLYNCLNWINPSGASPDYFHSCNPPLFFPPDIYIPNVGIPDNTFGYQFAQEGQAYAGFYAFSLIQSNLREYIQVELTDSIIKGISYKVSFYVSLSDRVRYSINTLGIYFSEQQINRNDVYKFEYTPQVINRLDNPLTSKDDWVLITDTFISNDGGEKYITIGNFNDDGESDTLYHYSGDTSAVYAYYYIDDVSVIALDTTIGIEENKQSKFEVFPNPNNGSFTIKLNEPCNNIAIELFDIQGQKIVNKKAIIKTKQLPVTIQDIAPGIYTLCITPENQQPYWQKVFIGP